MSKLRWNIMRAALPNVQQWGAKDGLVSYVITRDTGCRPDDQFYGRFAVSAKMAGSKMDDLGQYDTLKQAMAAAETVRVPTPHQGDR